MNDPIFRAFLVRQHEEGMRLAASSDLLALTPFAGNPPTHYVAEFGCTGLVREGDAIVEHSRWAVGIFFPNDYLRRAVDVAHVLTYLGDSPAPWHPNVRPPQICMHLGQGASLVEILMGLFDLFSWAVFNTSDNGLNPAAAQWARRQDPARFPLERRPLKRRLPLVTSGTSTPGAPA